jgi:hypothetical protein
MNKCSIVTPEEALGIIDVFAKRRGVYYLSCAYDVGSSWYWYWCSFRSKVPHYNVSGDNLSALASRFTKVLMALDELAFHYYSGANNDTMEYTMYHFNYFLALICGIFDSLAIETRDRLSIKFKGDHIPSRTSLYKRSGDRFLDALKVSQSPGPDLWGLINNTQDFIRVIYEMRELVLHREGIKQAGFNSQGKDGGIWMANMIDLRDKLDVYDTVKHWTANTRPYEPLTEWGIYNQSRNAASWRVLSPYVFAISATRKLTEFTDTFLGLMGLPDYLSTLSPEEPLRNDIDTMRVHAAGF